MYNCIRVFVGVGYFLDLLGECIHNQRINPVQNLLGIYIAM